MHFEWHNYYCVAQILEIGWNSTSFYEIKITGYCPKSFFFVSIYETRSVHKKTQGERSYYPAFFTE